MSSTGRYLPMPPDWEHQESDRSVGIMADGMTHIPCLDREHGGVADITGGGPVGLRLTGGWERFTEVWTCRDCKKSRLFRLDEHTAWDDPITDADDWPEQKDRSR